ncbi:ComEC/Rec2 family competence protein [Clostridium polynesiense]|uniref:ComEC/Rec2 family competence protein n=1 Tax=Clostridium polynesiense TaxID=1325933 RepID=UPI00058CAFC6|nr:MBL fold metallo-hydrolase [Clostridium polynesiense]
MKNIKILLTIMLTVILMLTGCSSGKDTSKEEFKPVAKKDYLSVSFINVGKGDAFLISTPDGKNYMIDTGKKDKYPVIKQLLQEKGINKLDGILLSHGHKDHIGGVQYLLEDMKVDSIYVSELDTVSYKKANLEDLASKYNSTLKKVKAGDEIILSESEIPVKAEVLGPISLDSTEANNNSMVLKITYGDNSFLMMGDAQFLEEMDIFKSGTALDADVLKTGHHGKDDASSQGFLSAVNPKYAILTGNKEEDSNSLSNKIIGRLQAMKTEIFVSEGDFLAVDFICDGKTITPVKFSKIQAK